MSTIKVQLLGGFTLESGAGKAPASLPRKARALLAFLALAGPAPQPRHRLAGLLWPDHGDEQARASLRQALTVIRRQVGDVLATDNETVGLTTGAFQIDVPEFEALAASDRPDMQARAIGLYRGDLLDGFHGDSPTFDQWQATERERLRLLAMDVATRMLALSEANGQTEMAVLLAARIVTIDPLREDAHRALMRLYSRQGRPTLALRQYRICRAMLEQELGVLPDAATERLFTDIARSRGAARRGGRGHPVDHHHVERAHPFAREAPGDAIADDDAEGSGGALVLVRTDEPVAPGMGMGETTVAPPGDRRQLTVMFCDMVHFAGLARRVDPEMLDGIVRDYEQACATSISRFEGHVFQRRGGTIVAFFGYPQAHEAEAERAIHAGLEILESLLRRDIAGVGPMAARIGIATGLVVVSPGGRGAVGEALSLAARLVEFAEPGSIVVSGHVRRLAGGRFDYQDAGRDMDPGADRPVQAYRIAGVSRVASRFAAATRSGLTPMIGREQEIGLLLGRWAVAQEGEGQVVMLSGEPGIGKSRILSALRERLDGRHARALYLQCSPYYANSAFWPCIEHLERVLKFGRDESAESRLDKLEALVVGRYQRALGDVRFIASMLSIGCEARYGTFNMTPQKFKDETIRVLVDLTEAMGRRQPSVLFFEDAHWADPTSLEVLDALIDRVRNIPLLIVVTHRPEFQSRWAAHGHVTGLTLSRLTRAQSGTMVFNLAGGKTLPANVAGQILAQADGVPLFVEELTKSILESGELKDAGDRYEFAGVTHRIAIPATLRDSLMARLDRHPMVKAIAQIGSAIGREFSYELVAAVAPVNQTQLDRGLVELAKSGLAFRRGTPPDATYTFKHALVQDAAYESLLKSSRQELHGRIARAVQERFPSIVANEPEVLARHLTAAGLAKAAIPLWRAAGELALSRMALSESISHLTAGLDLVDALPAGTHRDAEELGLRVPLGTAWMALKGWAAPEVWASFHPGLALAKSLGRHDALLPILSGLPQNVLCQGRVAESLKWTKEMLDTASAIGNTDLLVTGHTRACNCHFYLGNLHETLKHAERTLELYDAGQHLHLADILNHDPKSLVGVFSSISLWMLGYPDQAVRMVHESDAHSRRRGHPFDLGFALAQGGEVFDFRGEPEVLRQRALECDQLGRDNSLPVMSALLAPFGHGVAFIRDGRPAEGIAQLKAGLALWDSSGGKVRSPYLKAILAEGMAMMGDIDDALQLLDEQIEQVERPGWEERLYYAEILRLRGWVLMLKGETGGAERSYLDSIEWARGQQAKSWELRTSISLARLWQAEGRRDGALAVLAPIRDWFTEGFNTKDLREASALLDQLHAAT